MSKTLTLNTADLMGPTLQFPEYTEKFTAYSENYAEAFPEYTEQFPEFVEPIVHQFPEYIDPIDNMANLEPPSSKSPVSPVNRLVADVAQTPSRHPSPQPAHFNVPYKNGNGNGNGHRVLRSATVGYVAPEFKGKKAQMVQGKTQYFNSCGILGPW